MHDYKWHKVSEMLPDKCGIYDVKIKNCYDEIVNPALINSLLPKSTTWEEYMSLYYPMIDMCDAIYFLDGWEESAGAKIEFDYACRKNKGIYFKDI